MFALQRIPSADEVKGILKDYERPSADDEIMPSNDAPEWVTEVGGVEARLDEDGVVVEIREPAPASDALYVLVDTRGDMVSRSGLSAHDFLTALHARIDQAPNEGERRAWKARNRRELQRLRETEGGELANEALDLLS